MYKKQDIEKLKEVVDYYEFYSQYIPDLPKYSRIPCPIHNGTKNNFQINFNTGIWKCFSASCNKYGDIYDFIQIMDDVSLAQSIRKVAKFCNYELEESEDAKKEREIYKNFAIFNKKLVNHFHKNLVKDKDGKQYLLQRFNNKENIVKAIREFRLGLYDPEKIMDIINDDELEIALDVGVVKKNKDGNIVPFNSVKRISIPYIEKDMIKSFTFRAIDPNVDLRYYKKNNSLFNHKDLLYGYNNAIESIKKYRHAIITEGNLDVISAHLSGLRTTIGMSGSNMTDTQLNKIKNYCKVIYIVVEDKKNFKALKGCGENKGIYSKIKEIMPFVQVKIVKMYDEDNKVDLNEYFKTNNFSDFKKLLKESKVYNEFILDDIYSNMKINNIDDKMKYLNICKKHLLSIRVSERVFYINELSKLLEIPSEEIEKQLKKKEKYEITNEITRKDEIIDKRYATVQKVLCSFMFYDNVNKQNLINLFDKYQPQQYFRESFLEIFNEIMFLFITAENKTDMINELLKKDVDKNKLYDIILKTDTLQKIYKEEDFEDIFQNQINYLKDIKI